MALGSFGSRAVVPGTVAAAPVDHRVGFIRRTYGHLAGAIVAFVVLEYALFQTGIAASLTETVLASRWGWLIVLGAFMVVGMIADRWARSATSPGMQYLGLGLYVLAEALIFAPLLFLVAIVAEAPEVIPQAGLMTLVLFGGLTATVFMTKKDFSFLRGALTIASFAALGVIVAGILFGFELGLFFAFLMVALASGYVLYYTSNIIHHYRTDQHVAASLALFAAIALMFWYIIRILMELRR